jgi:protein phosphatase
MLRQALEAANERIYRSAQEESALHGMGTTGVALLLEPGGGAWVAHVGDSRAYQLRDGKLQPITADHSAVAELQRRGMITAEEAAVHPRRNELLRSIGVEPDVEVDVSPVDVQPGDCFLLCSDGLSGVVSDEEIAAVIQSQPPEQAVRTLVESANARGGPDNITVIVAAVSREVAAFPTDEGDPGDSAKYSQVRSIAAVAVVVALLLLVALFVLLWSGSGPTP